MVAVVACEICGGEEFHSYETFLQVTGEKGSPSLEITVGLCEDCEAKTVIERRVV